MNGKITQIDLLSKSLEAAELRHRVISQNLANVNTPNYRAVDIDFQETLQKVLEPGSEISADEARLLERPGLTTRLDGNNVDVDMEIGDLNKNAMMYQTYTQLLASKLGQMKTAISGR